MGNRRRTRRTGAEALAVAPEPALADAARDRLVESALAKIARGLGGDGPAPPPPDAAAVAIMRAHWRSQGIDLDDGATVAAARERLVASLWAAAGHTSDCAPTCRDEHL